MGRKYLTSPWPLACDTEKKVMLWLYYKYRLPIFILSNAETIWMQPGKYLKYKLVEKMRKRSVSGSGCIWYCSHFIQSLTWHELFISSSKGTLFYVVHYSQMSWSVMQDVEIIFGPPVITITHHPYFCFVSYFHFTLCIRSWCTVFQLTFC